MGSAAAFIITTVNDPTMHVLIIEDELPAFKRLKKQLQELSPAIDIVAHLDGIEAARCWMAVNDVPDIIFLDIHLSDGSAFDLLKAVNITCPVIFTTAYDQYAMDAFKTTGIDYLLKPIKKAELQQALFKVKQLQHFFHSSGEKQEKEQAYRNRFIIRYGEHIKTLNIEDIAYFYSENRATFARNFEGRNFPVDYNLDALSQLIDPKKFFRINRQYLVSLAAIADMKTYSKARIIITLNPTNKEQPVVSSERSSVFKRWLGDE